MTLEKFGELLETSIPMTLSDGEDTFDLSSDKLSWLDESILNKKVNKLKVTRGGRLIVSLGE